MQKTPQVGMPGRGICSVLFLDDSPMVPSPKLSFITNVDNPTGIDLALGSTIHFGSLEFITDHLGRLSLPPRGMTQTPYLYVCSQWVAFPVHYPRGVLW
jgi:hypothetical protein